MLRGFRREGFGYEVYNGLIKVDNGLIKVDYRFRVYVRGYGAWTALFHPGERQCAHVTQVW